MRRVLKLPAFRKKKGSVKMIDLLAECGYTFKTSQEIIAVLIIAASIVHHLTPICAGYGVAIKPAVGKL